MRSRNNLSARLNVSLFRQNGQTWSDDVMQTCGQKIGTDGCLLTSFAMINRFFGRTENPGQVNSIMGNQACDWYWGTATARFGFVVHSFREGSPSGSAISVDTVRAHIVGAINTGHPVIVLYLDDKGRRHHVVAYAYTGSGSSISVLDPNSLGGFSNINQIVSAGLPIVRIITYTHGKATPPPLCDPFGSCFTPWQITLPEYKQTKE